MADSVPMIDLSRIETEVTRGIDAAIARVRQSGRYLLGAELSAFEEAFAAYCGTSHCVGVASGTDALELALRAAGCGPGDTVATVANAGGFASNAILAVGARPLYVDVDPDSLNMSPRALAAAMTPAVKAVIVTHLYGRLADMEALAAAAGNAVLIEDAAQAHGAERCGKRAGSFGAIGCFSFYPTKNLGAMGDAGALTTSDADIADRLRSLRGYGWEQRFVAHHVGGRNSRMDEMQAAVLLAKLPWLQSWNVRRREIAAAYRQALSGLGLALPDVTGADHVVHQHVVRVQDRDALRARLGAAGIGCDVHYPVPDYRQPALAVGREDVAPLPETEAAVTEILSLPCHPWMQSEEVAAVAEAVRAGLGKLS